MDDNPMRKVLERVKIKISDLYPNNNPLQYGCEHTKRYCEKAYYKNGRHKTLGFFLHQRLIDDYTESCRECVIERESKVRVNHE
jgi:hypothetical protein